jgi:hypothetical protein
MDKWRIAVLVLEVFQRNVWPDDDDLIARIKPYVTAMRADYAARKWTVGFLEASRDAQVALFRRIEDQHGA